MGSCARFRVVSAIVLAIACTSPARGQDCDEVLHHGIYDFHHKAVDLNMTKSYMSWFCSEQFKNEKETNDFGASVGFPFKGIPVKLGFNSNSGNWSDWYSKTCDGFTSDESLQIKARDQLDTINSRVIDAWEKCIGTDGLHVWIERTDDLKVFHIGAKWTPPDPETHPTTVASLRTDKWVICRPNKKVIKHQFNGPIRCDRTDVLQPATITVEAMPGPIVGGGVLSLAGEPAAGPVGWSDPHTERNSWTFAQDDIRKCGPSDITGVSIDSAPTTPGNDYYFTPVPSGSCQGYSVCNQHGRCQTGREREGIQNTHGAAIACPREGDQPSLLLLKHLVLVCLQIAVGRIGQ